LEELPHTHEQLYVEGYQGNRNPLCRRCAVEALLAERQPTPTSLSVEQVQKAVDASAGYTNYVKMLTDRLNGLLADTALTERQESPESRAIK